MKLADELVVQHGFDPVNMAPEAWKANKAIATSVDEALSEQRRSAASNWPSGRTRAMRYGTR